MRELGEGSSAYHRDLLAPVTASGADLVFACGPFMQELFDRLPADRRGAWAPTSIELVPAVRAALRAGDVVMVKGSLGTNMAPLVAAIRSRLASAPPAKS
jgi:UDP-N-acetylmuramoyl-tripeptide--D-alanyl-D-alanine ligase